MSIRPGQAVCIVALCPVCSKPMRNNGHGYSYGLTPQGDIWFLVCVNDECEWREVGIRVEKKSGAVIGVEAFAGYDGRPMWPAHWMDRDGKPCTPRNSTSEAAKESEPTEARAQQRSADAG